MNIPKGLSIIKQSGDSSADAERDTISVGISTGAATGPLARSFFFSVEQSICFQVVQVDNIPPE